ncbi:DUF6777 domain-containing protein [Rhodococcus daqingensis]|uniref:DUF6777 domain-containing protein n=1 Tax=Rhodococcus daqingensis TaxID=2479363 RepID=A0ABW2S011_9NOCA
MATVIAGPAARFARRSTVASTGPRARHAAGCWLVVACAVFAAGCSNGTETQHRPIALDRVVADGQLPWTDRLLPPQIPTVVPPGPPGADLPRAGASLHVPGDRVGLYGGSPDRVLCDRQRLVDDLEGDPTKVAAWSAVLDVDDVRSYVRTLTPVLLRGDTRVTNHGYSGRRATSYQSVLEAGTIVLIDDRGTPRVRCARGSPLIDPYPGSEPAAEDPWSGFDADRLMVVQPAQQPMAQVTVVDLMTGGLVAVPIGAGPQQPADRPGAPPPMPPPPPPPPVPAPQLEPLAVAPPPVQRQAPEPPPPPEPPPAPEPPPPPAPVPVAPPPPPPQIQVQIPGLPPLVIPIP